MDTVFFINTGCKKAKQTNENALVEQFEDIFNLPFDESKSNHAFVGWHLSARIARKITAFLSPLLLSFCCLIAERINRNPDHITCMTQSLVTECGSFSHIAVFSKRS